MNQPGIILLREGTDSSQGKAQLVSNINACQVGGVAFVGVRVALELASAGCCCGNGCC